MMGVDEPDYGHLLDEMEVFEDRPGAGRAATCTRGSRSRSGSCWPTICPGRAAPRTTCWPRRRRSRPAIELIDTRIKDWKIKLCDTIADNASSAGWVLGEARVSPKDIDIQSIDAVLTRNGEVVAEGRSDAVLGNPVTAVAWLARKVDSFGVRLKAGDIVLPGSCTRAFDATPGRRFRRRLRRAGFGPPVVRVGGACTCRARHPSPSSGRATSAPTCCTSCCARSGSSRAGWSASTPTARAWRGPASWAWRPAHEGVDWLLGLDEKPDLVFEATSAYVHRDAAPRYAEAGIRAIDLTPAAVGPGGDPAGQPARAPRRAERQHDHLRRPGHHPDGVRGVAASSTVPYAEIVASVASASAGPGTRANIDEFTKTTSKGVETIGGAERGKAIIILNPADPPMIMRDTIFCAIPEDADQRRDRAVDPATWSPRCRTTCPATGCSTSRSSTTAVGQLGRPGAWSRRSSRWRARATTCRRTPATWTS